MPARTISSASLVLYLMCKLWGPVSNSKTLGRNISDWLILLAYTAAGRAIIFHLVYSMLLDFKYCYNVLICLTGGILLAKFMFENFISSLPSSQVSKKKSKRDKDKVHRFTTMQVVGDSDNNTAIISLDRLEGRLKIMQYITGISSSLSFIWGYSGSFILALVCTPIFYYVHQAKNRREPILVASYLLSPTWSDDQNLFYVLHFIGGLGIFLVFRLDKNAT